MSEPLSPGAAPRSGLVALPGAAALLCMLWWIVWTANDCYAWRACAEGQPDSTRVLCLFVIAVRRAWPGRGEADFEALLAASGFAVRHVPTAQLHEEYRGGEYCVLRACLLDP